MQKISYNEQYGMQQAVFEGYKEMTRREPIFEEIKEPRTEFNTRGHLCLYDGDRLVHVSRYAVGEIVAVAQAYKDLDYSLRGFATNPDRTCGIRHEYAKKQAGWNNKMFVSAKFMPHQIRITDIKAERLQDISDEDCLREGIKKYGFMTYHWVAIKTLYGKAYKSPRDAFAALINKVSGKGTWERNPWVFAYSFELVK